MTAGWGGPPGAAEPAAVGERLAKARERIAAAGADPQAVRVVAVTKGFGPDAVRAAQSAGLRDVGENYAQELVAKATALSDPELRWHFLGAVQRNKVALLAPVVWCWQALARAVEGEAIARRHPGARVLVEVALTGDPGRGGCRPDAVPALVSDLRGMDLVVEGLMAVAPRDADPAAGFRVVRMLADRLDLRERSMGMSDDFEVAVAEGSTMVRLGRLLFGPRPVGRPRPVAR